MENKTSGKTIAVDVSPMQYRGTGVARYTRELTLHMLRSDKKNNYILFYNSFGNSFSTLTDSAELINFENVTLKEFRIPEKILHFLWNRLYVLPIELLIGKHDVFFYSDWFTPPSSAFRITTIHDMIFKKYRETVHPYIRSTQEARIRFFEKNEAAILVNSETTKSDIVAESSIAKERIHVLHFGVSAFKQPEAKVKETRAKYRLNKPYILSVGKQEPRKNIPRLIEAFEKLNRTDIDLVLTGPVGWGKQLVTRDNVRFIGFVDDTELYALYQDALFFIIPSLYEGFGFPLLEAMALGCPTAASKGSALSEIGKNVSYFFDPQSVRGITDGMKKLIENKALRAELAHKGIVRAAEFSWDRTADEVLAIMRSFL